MILDDDDVVLLVTLLPPDPRVKLAVTLVDPDRATVTEARAKDVLRHFRGIKRFVQTDFSNEIAGARMYLGGVETCLLRGGADPEGAMAVVP
jgi:hypothetical protein